MNDDFGEILSSLNEKIPRSRLAPYRNLIIELRRRRRTYREIQNLLREKCQLQVSLSTLHDFMHTRKKPANDTHPVASTKLQCPQEEGISAKNPLPEKPKPMPAMSVDEIRQRIAALKQRRPKPEPEEPRFKYDATQPLHLNPE